jgi:hypothetical protein
VYSSKESAWHDIAAGERRNGRQVIEEPRKAELLEKAP